MNLLQDIITYIRRIIKSPNNDSITDALIIDYINRFYIMDVDARVQLFDLQTKYTFTTRPGVCDYNTPLYSIPPFPASQEPNQTISYYPVYQGFMMPCYVNGIQVPFYTQRDPFFKLWPWYLQTLNPAGTGNGTQTAFTLNLPFSPAIPGHVDITGIIRSNSALDPIIGASLNDPAIVDSSVPLTSLYPGVFITAANTANQTMVVTDSGQFSSTNAQIGFLQTVAPGTTTISAAGTINYSTGVASVTFPSAVISGGQIQTQCYFFAQGLPRAILFHNNTIKVLPPPDIPYVVEMDAYISPASFLSTADSIPFAYMSEYIARGAARKILADTGDVEQFAFYEPLFKEQELLVWKRSQRQFTASRTGTIFSDLQGQSNYNNIGQGAAT